MENDKAQVYVDDYLNDSLSEDVRAKLKNALEELKND